MFKELTLEQFVDEVASNRAVPGGGSVAAVVAAQGTALLEMVCQLTVGKKNYVDVSEAMDDKRRNLEPIRRRLLDLSEEDSASYAKVMEAFGLPKETDDDKAARSKAIQDATYEAALVPLEVAKTALKALEEAPFIFEKGNKNAVSDAQVASLMLRSAILSALYNVTINTESLKDETKRNQLDDEVQVLRKEALALERDVIGSL